MLNVMTRLYRHGGLMNYGEVIRSTREHLDLFQRDLSNTNLSRNLLSNIEHGKTSLTPNKALMIYKSLVEHALLKDIEIDIEFDILLATNDEYRVFKLVYETCKRLKHHHVPEEDLYIVEKTLKKWKLGSIEFFYLTRKAQSKHFENEVRTQAYMDSLDYVIQNKDYKFIEQYGRSLHEMTLVMSLNDANTKPLKYVVQYEDFLRDGGHKIPPNLYYNLALYYRRNRQYDLAQLNVDKFLATDPNDRLRINILITQGLITTYCASPIKGLYHFLEILEHKSIEANQKAKAMILGNIVFVAWRFNIELSHERLIAYAEEMTSIINHHQEQLRNISTLTRVKSSIALAYYLTGDYDKAKLLFDNIWKNISTELYLIYAEVLSESFDTYLATNNLDFIVDKAMEINYNKLSLNQKNEFMHFIVRSQNMMLVNDTLNFSSKLKFIDYIKNLTI